MAAFSPRNHYLNLKSKSRKNMMRSMFHKLLWLTFMFTAFAPTNFGQIKSVKAQTEDGQVITVWLPQKSVQMGMDVVVNYRIENGGSKKVYLLKKELLEVYASDDGIVVNPLIVGSDEFGATDYTFIPIDRKKSYQSQFVIPSEKVARKGVWFVEIGLAFVTDIKDLQPRTLRDPASFRGILADRAISTKIGKLYLLVQ